MDASEQNGGAASPDLAPDAPTTQGQSGAVALVGYLGDAGLDQYRRLYENVALNRWIDIPVAAIVARFRATGGGDQSVIWVQRDAELVWCRSVRASSYEGPPEPDPGAGPRPLPLKWPRP